MPPSTAVQEEVPARQALLQSSAQQLVLRAKPTWFFGRRRLLTHNTGDAPALGCHMSSGFFWIAKVDPPCNLSERKKLEENDVCD